MNDIEMEMEIILEDENQEQTLAQIRAARSFFGPASSATSPNALSEEMTLANLSRRKLELQLSLALFNQRLPNSNISVESGNEIVMRNDYSEYPLLG